MSSLFDTHILLTGLSILAARIVDVCLGTVFELYVACRRLHLSWLLPIIKEFDEKIFYVYVIEPARGMNKEPRPFFSPHGGWHSRHIKKGSSLQHLSPAVI